MNCQRQYNTILIVGSRASPIINAMSGSYSYLDHLYSDFLLQRALMKHLHTTTDALLITARELLSSVLTLASQRDKLLMYQCDIAWNVGPRFLHFTARVG